MIVERAMDAAWPDWRGPDMLTLSAFPKQMLAIISEVARDAFAAGKRAGSVRNAVDVEAEVQKRIRTVTEHHAVQLAEAKRESADAVEKALKPERRDTLDVVRLVGDELAEKHGRMSQLALVVREVERLLLARIAGAVRAVKP